MLLPSSSSPASPAANLPVITLTLLHPIQSTPVQSWTFEHDDVIRIGRSADNHVVLYSAVVSRNHVELRRNGQEWEVVSLGANGTYVNGQRVVRQTLHDGLVFRLARSGPNLQVYIGAESRKAVAATIKSPSRSANRIVFVDDDDMPNTLGLPGADPAILESATHLSLGNTAFSDLAVPAEPELLFSTETGQPLKVLNTLGEYQVVKVIGQGETGVTSLVWRLGRTAVMKNLNAQIASQPQAAAIFRQLCEQLKQVNHPGIPRVLETIEQDGKTYLVMEMAYGQPLSQYVAQHGVLPEREAIAWILELGETLEFMHRQGLFHGHITPANVVKRSVMRSGQSIVLTDFGPVRVWQWQCEGGFNATSFAAPELKDGILNDQSDLYGLGTTLAFLLTGKDPRHFYMQAEEGFRFYPRTLPAISSKMVEVLHKLTSPTPSDRYASIKDVTAALKQIV
jgi:pSer/pThr/pTyr-binding forkhead associated (FHA) protein